MTVFARFKYDKDRPSLRVHIWDIFDEANLSTNNFENLFDCIYDKLDQIFEEQDFESEISEISIDKKIDYEGQLTHSDDS